MKQFLLIFSLFFLSMVSSFAQGTSEDKENLSRAIEYFNNEKFHEAGLLLRNLNKIYNLNTRFKAYLGVCEYHDWNYTAVTEIFDSIYTELSVYAPLEQNVYYNVAADSHFNLTNYREALKYYELALKVCSKKEKGDLCFKAGFCCYQLKRMSEAKIYFTRSLSYYRMNPTGNDDKARISQIRKMLRAILIRK